jgi:hypothetical protein
MGLHLSGGRLVVEMVLYLLLVAGACGSGCWSARSLPVRFNGEKVLISLFIGSLTALACYGVEKLMLSQVQPSRPCLILGWFLLQGLAGEVTVQWAARHKGRRPEAP